MRKILKKQIVRDCQSKKLILDNMFIHKIKKVKVKVSHSQIAVGAVGVRVPLYLGHS